MVSASVLLTCLVLVLVLAALTLTRGAPDMILLGGLAVLIMTGVLPAKQALQGFANPGVATIAALFVVADGLRRTGGLEFVGRSMLLSTRSPAFAQLQVTIPAAGMSAVMNNTPVVAMMIPVIREWAQRCRISESKLLIPLSYASILGGLLTLVGTSTTLVINGMLLSTPGVSGLGMFEIGFIGLPVALVGLVYIPVASRWLLPERRTAFIANKDAREYAIEMVVEDGSPLVGRSVREGGLRHLPGLFLLEMVRSGHVVPAVGPDTRLEAGDRLVFVGIVDSVIQLQSIRGLRLATDQFFNLGDLGGDRGLVEVVVSNTAPFIGLTIRDAQFRTRYQAGVIAVARHGERIRKKVGDIQLAAGDTLLLSTLPSFVELHRNSNDFFMTREIAHPAPIRADRAWVSRVILVAMILCVVFAGVSMLQASCMAGVAMVATRCLRLSQVRSAIDWSVVLGVGAGIGLGAAMAETGTAQLLGTGLVAAAGADPMVNLGAVAVVTMLLANVITTKAAAILMYPIALTVADSVGVSFRPFAIAIIVSAASAFLTPVGYQTNLMVYGPGGYRSSDFVRLGGPLSILVLAVVVVGTPWVWAF